jgi:hypothetical protein
MSKFTSVKSTKPEAQRKTASGKSNRAKKNSAKTAMTTKLVWRDTVCRVKHTPNYINKGWSHLEIVVVAPKGAPLPITGTGYRSHFLTHELIEAAGGPVAFFQRWLDTEATTKAWAKADFQ